MPKKLLAPAMAAALAIVGCVSYHTPPDDRRVTVSPDLGAAVWVTDVRLANGASTHCTLQANVANNTDDVVPVEYRVVWLDGSGMEIPRVVSTWQFKSAAPREVFALTATAPSPAAADFRLYVQPARR
jgi:uncharacterized protein YcfL